MLKLDEAIFNQISHKVMVDINVLYPTMKHGILGHGYHVDIITIHWNGKLNMDV